MFTGIITDIGIVKEISKNNGMDVKISCQHDMRKISIGDSIACSGICLTVVDKGDSWFIANISEETIKCSNCDKWHIGSEINLEKSLKMGDELSGHIVTGHIDTTVTIISIKKEGNSRIIALECPKKDYKLIAPKGSVTLNGISLTVNEVKQEKFIVNIIPHTFNNTSLRNSIAGDKINLEFDVIARYIANMLPAYNQTTEN